MPFPSNKDGCDLKKGGQLSIGEYKEKLALTYWWWESEMVQLL